MKRDVFQAIADPTRRAIITLLAVQAMTPNALAAHFASSRQAISKHIKILHESALVQQAPQGRENYYFLNPSRMQEVDAWLNQFRQLWEQRFEQLDAVLHQQKTDKK